MKENYSESIQQALILVSEGKANNALVILNASIHHHREKEDLAALARLLGTKGLIFTEQDLVKQARKCFDEVVEISEKIEDDSIKCDAISNIGLLFAKEGDPGTCLLKQQEAAALARNLDNDHKLMILLGVLGHSYLQLANFEEAGKVYYEALKLAKKLDDKLSLMGFLNNLGVIFINLDQHENAIKTFQDAVDTAGELEHFPMMVNAYKQQVKQMIASSDTDGVISQSEKALKLLKEKMPESAEIVLFEDMLVLGLMSNENYAEAAAILQDSLERLGSKEKQRKMEILGKLADAKYALDDLDQSMEILERARKLSQELEDAGAEGRMLGRMASISADLGNMELSDKYCLQSIEKCENVGDHQTVGEQFFILALNKKEENDLENAEQYCRKSISAFQKTSLKPYIERSMKLLEELS